MRPSWKAGRGVWVCLPLFKTSEPVVLHIEEEALWLLIFYYFICTFLRRLWQFLRSFHLCAVLFVLFVLSVSGPHRLRGFSLKGIFPKMGVLILIS